jgi:hypothetical protein
VADGFDGRAADDAGTEECEHERPGLEGRHVHGIGFLDRDIGNPANVRLQP